MSYLKKITPVSRITDTGTSYEYTMNEGMPIGLLLSLTYTKSSSYHVDKFKSPISRIKETILSSRINKSSGG